MKKWQIILTVSYTHLDVYKRQVPVDEMVKDMRSLFNPIAKDKKIEFEIVVDKTVPSSIATDKMRAVSYTHLDVYKRQIYRSG